MNKKKQADIVNIILDINTFTGLLIQIIHSDSDKKHDEASELLAMMMAALMSALDITSSELDKGLIGQLKQLEKAGVQIKGSKKLQIIESMLGNIENAEA